MSNVEKLPNEPIIVITESGIVDKDYVSENMRKVDELAKDLDEGFHLLIDARESDSDFAKVMEILRSDDGYQPIYAPITATFVGNSSMLRMFRHASSLDQFGGDTSALFADKETALESSVSTSKN